MNPSLLLLVGSLFYIIMIAILYFKKPRIPSIENKIYKYLLFVGIFGIVMDITGIYVHSNLPDESLIRWFVLRFYHSYLLTTIFLLSLYMVILKYEKITKKCEKNIFLLIGIYVVCLIVNFITPVVHHKEGNIIYATGPNINFLYLVAGIAVLCWTVYIIKNFKKLKKKKYTPIIIFVISSVPVLSIQMQDPSLLLVTSLITFVIVFMYHTIENPDVKLIAELEIARDAAEKASHAKSDFLSSMSHEIRTPLNAIVGLSEDMKNYKDQLPNEVIEDIEDIGNASGTLLEIVGNILDINKIESGKMELVNLPYNLVEEIKSLVSVTTTRIGEKPITFHLNLNSNLPYQLLGDKVHIKGVINNLLSNAIKYTDAGSISLNVHSINNDTSCLLSISVVDTGKGIREEDISRLFSKFERLDIEKNSTIEGTGLGLAITKKLVEMMNGTINVQSEFGKGSTFVVQIPQEIIEMNAPVEKAVEVLEVVEEKSYGHKKILLVDDNKLNIKVARKALDPFDFEITECSNGVEALEHVVNGDEYDLILLDIMMPVMGGEETMQKLKEKPGFHIPVLALTADAVDGAKERYLSLGFTDYLAKPFTKKELEERLDAIWKK